MRKKSHFAPAGRGAAAGVYHTPEGSPPGGLPGPGAWVLHKRRGGRTQATRHWLIPKARGYNMEHTKLAVGVANRVRLRTRIDLPSQSHALSRRGRVVYHAVTTAT